MKKRILPIMLLLILLPNAFASITIEAEKNNIIIGTNQYAKYLINIVNDYNYTESFEPYLKDFSWSVTSDPLSDYIGGGITLLPGESHVIHLYLRPPKKINLGSYSLPLIITEQKTKKQDTKILTANIVSGQPSFKEYAIAVTSSINFPVKIDPRKNYTLNVYVSNSFPRDIKGLKISIESEIFKVDKILDLGPLDSANLKFKVKLNQYTKPISDVMKLKCIIDGKVISEAHQGYHVISYSNLKKENETVLKKFLYREVRFTYFNDGNVKNSQTIYYPVSKFKRLFTHSQPSYYVISKKGGGFLAWDLVLDPQAKQEIIVKQSYKSPFIVLLALLFFIVLYYVLRSSIVVQKNIKLLEIKDGAISELKVLIHIKNRSNSKLTNIKVGDRVPGLVNVEKEFEIGTIQPKKITKDVKGATLLRWEIDELEAYEERIISYKVKARLKVLGHFSLPPALVKYRTLSGSELKARSGRGRVLQD